MDWTQLLILIFGPILALLLSSVVYYVQRTQKLVDKMYIILPTLVTDEKCKERTLSCMERQKIKVNGDSRADALEEKLFLEKWESLLTRVRRLENLLSPSKEVL
jgi:hypothetical protein